jgi:hypothetical protein
MGVDESTAESVDTWDEKIKVGNSQGLLIEPRDDRLSALAAKKLKEEGFMAVDRRGRPFFSSLVGRVELPTLDGSLGSPRSERSKNGASSGWFLGAKKT